MKKKCEERSQDLYMKNKIKKKAVLCLTKTEAENKGGADANST